jgi:indole-3-glycerol phosphate synthase/phosphoribosylanthranilate isomerase/anthranilate synthase/indole-3-glycerol phosphate synthase/phosphoribosylanthranilate isomerase
VNFLARVVPVKQRAVAERRAHVSLAELERRITTAAPPVRSFATALRDGPGERIIAEIKRHSPSVARFRQQGPVAELARTYVAAGAAAISVVTDRAHFGTSLDDVARVRAAVDLPVLVKDFVVDPYQVYEARLGGADALLLIARILSAAELAGLRVLVERLGMAALVECHDEQDLQRALTAGATLIGVNNRDLDSFGVSLAASQRLAGLVPAACTCVAESGIHRRADVEDLAAAGAGAFLVGGALLDSTDPGRKLRELRGEAVETDEVASAAPAAEPDGAAATRPAPCPRVKICGLTTPAEARACAELGADYLGVIFADSPRRVSPQRAAELRRAAPGACLVGVFRDTAPEEILDVAEACGLDAIQLHGDEPETTSVRLREASGRTVIKALAPDPAGPAVAPTVHAAADILLLDLPKDRTPRRTRADGGGEHLWRLAAALGAAGRDVMLAGGLAPGNVAAAIARARPVAVDVCSGVEREPGVKDLDRVRIFLEEVRRA